MDIVVAKKQTQKRTLLSIHKDKECDCFDADIIASLKKCNYRSFPDGWSFVSDAGNAQARGEIFTPRWIVDKMIVDSGMLPAKAVYENNYSNPKLKYISARVNEPAVGTANYLATILYHKLRYAKELSIDKDSLLDLAKYQTHLLFAVASIYAYDIDAGNLEITKRRLLSLGKQKINTPRVRDQWAMYITSWINQDPEKKRKIGYNRVKPSVQKSLDEAQIHWYKFVKDGHGIIDVAYKKATDSHMPGWLYDQCLEILGKNIKLFNGIKEIDSLDWTNDLFVPGYKTVVWTWWHFDYPHEAGWQPMSSEKEVPLMRIILNSQLDKIETEIKELKLEFYNKDNKSWDNSSHQKHHKSLQLKFDKIKLEIQKYTPE